jgi:periplasmic protein TonB
MDYARQQRNPSRHLIGIGGVVLFHALLIWGLISGLARKVVEVVKGPIEVKVIEEVKTPPPPAEVIPPPPKLAAPPPPFIPPPEINIAPPPTPAPAITAVTREAPPAPVAPVIRPPAPPVAKAPPPPPPPAGPKSARVVCPNYVDVMSKITYPRQALLDGTEGEVLIEFTVAASGEIKDVEIKSSTNRIFNRPALSAVQSGLTCQGQGADVRVQAPVSFKIR